MLIAITGLPSHSSAAAAIRIAETFVPHWISASTSSPSSARKVSRIFSGVTSAIAVLACPHPLQARAEPLGSLRLRAARHIAYFQLPSLPERAMASSDLVVRLLREWGARGWTTPEIEDTYRQAARVPFAAHSAMERSRWLVRSAPRVDGQRYLGALRSAPAVPVLQLHGGEDGCRPAATAAASGRLLARLGAGYRFELIPDAGHFLAEEAPDRVNALLLSWLREVAPVSS